MQATGVPNTEALPSRSRQLQGNRIVFHTRVAVTLGNLS